MKRFIIIVSILLGFSFAFAEENNSKIPPRYSGFALGADILSQFAIGDYSDFALMNIGASIAGEYTLPLEIGHNMDLGISLRGDFGHVIPKTSSALKSDEEVRAFAALWWRIPFNKNFVFQPEIGGGVSIFFTAYNLSGTDKTATYFSPLITVTPSFRFIPSNLQNLELEAAPLFTIVPENSKATIMAGLRLGAIWHFNLKTSSTSNEEKNQQKLAKAETKRIEKEKRKAEAKRIADEKEKQKAEEARIAEEKRLEEERQLAEAKRIADEKEKQKAEEARLAEEKRLEEERQLAEAKRIADEKEKQKAEETRIAEEKRLEEERQLAEAKRIADEKEKQKAEEARLAEQKRKAEEEAALKAEEARIAEEKRLADEQARQIEEEIKLAQKKSEPVNITERLNLKHILFFSPNGAVFSGLSREQIIQNNRTIDEAVAIIKKYPGCKITIEGYANNISGTEEENRRACIHYSLWRAEYVKKELIARGISADRIDAVGKGDANPMASRSDRANWWKNRRVEFVITYESEGTENE